MSLNGGWDVLGILVKSLGVRTEIFQIKNIIIDLMIGLISLGIKQNYGLKPEL